MTKGVKLPKGVKLVDGVIPKFKAVYNPFTRELYVRYGYAIIKHIFEDTDEWVCIPFNGNQEHPNYLHIQLDFNEYLELLCYPRVDDDESLHENLGSYYYHGCKGRDNSPNIKFVFTSVEQESELTKLNVGVVTWYKVVNEDVEIIDHEVQNKFGN
jgi:hypothetical protein